MRVCSHSGCRRLAPKKNAKPTQDTRAAIRKLRDLKSDRSTIGYSALSSQINQAAKAMTATIVSTMIAEELNQSASLPVSSITCKAPTQVRSRTTPVRSMGTSLVGVSRLIMLRQQTTLQTIPTGTLIRKIQGQEILSEM